MGWLMSEPFLLASSTTVRPGLFFFLCVCWFHPSLRTYLSTRAYCSGTSSLQAGTTGAVRLVGARGATLGYIEGTRAPPTRHGGQG